MRGEWQLLIALNERLRPLQDPIEIQKVTVQLIGEHFQASRVHYAQIDDDEFVIGPSYTGAVPPFRHRGHVSDFGRTILETCRRGETFVVTDARTDSRFNDDERAHLLSSDFAAFVTVPLIKKGRWVAAFAVHTATPRRWTDDEIALIEITADRTWSADARARAEEALDRGNDRRLFLAKLNDTIRPLADPARILAETCRLLGEHLHVNRVAYVEIEGGYATIANDYVNGVPSQTGRFRWADLAASRTAEALHGETLFANDTSLAPHTPAERDALQARGIGAYISPVLVKNGRLVASFGIHSREPRTWTADEIALVQDVADRTWTALEYCKAEGELRANKDRLQFLLRLNDALRPLGDPGDIQETAARLLGEHLGASRVGYAESDGREYVIHREYTHGVPPLAGQKPAVDVAAVLREAVRRGEIVAVDNVQTDPRLTMAERATLEQRQIAAFVGTALFKDGRMVGAFSAHDHAPRVWATSEIELVRGVGERTWDAVERSRAEAALQGERQRLHVALEASGAGSWTWVVATNRVDWDERFRPLYGFAPDEPATADGWLARVHEDDRAGLLALREEIWASKTTDSFESTFRIVHPDGTVRWIQSRGRVNRDADGNVTQLIGLDLDFDQHHQTEEALQARREEEHNRELRLLLETATQGIVSVDADGVILTANRALETMFGWSVDELIGERVELLLPSSLRDIHMAQRSGYFAAPRARLMGGGLALVGKRKDGSTFPIEVSLNHVRTADGGRAIAFVTDITERQRAASTLQERTSELEYRTMQLRRMASDLTLAEQRAREEIAKTLHDGLQQVLVIAALNLEQHLKGDSSESIELVCEAKYQIEEAIGAARSLSFELFPPVLQQSGLPAALLWLANWTRDKYKRDVRVVADPAADSSRQDLRTLLFESVRELVFNAVKHAHADRITLELSLEHGDLLCITVADEGIGFEPAELDQRSETGQVGWGLFSIRERLTLLGGRFHIDSAPGKGTRVRLIAPRGRVQRDADATLASTLEPIGAAPDVDNDRMSPDALRIVIVDDHAGVRSTFRDMLNKQAQFVVVGDGADGFEAIAQAHTLRPDVILMDISMPHMDGIEATARIHAELPDIQIFGLSMQPRSVAAEAIEHAGAAGFFVKGIDTQRLIEHLLVLHESRVGHRRT